MRGGLTRVTWCVRLGRSHFHAPDACHTLPAPDGRKCGGLHGPPSTRQTVSATTQGTPSAVSLMRVRALCRCSLGRQRGRPAWRSSRVPATLPGARRTCAQPSPRWSERGSALPGGDVTRTPREGRATPRGRYEKEARRSPMAGDFPIDATICDGDIVTVRGRTAPTTATMLPHSRRMRPPSRCCAGRTGGCVPGSCPATRPTPDPRRPCADSRQGRRAHTR